MAQGHGRARLEIQDSTPDFHFTSHSDFQSFDETKHRLLSKVRQHWASDTAPQDLTPRVDIHVLTADSCCTTESKRHCKATTLQLKIRKEKKLTAVHTQQQSCPHRTGWRMSTRTRWAVGGQGWRGSFPHQARPHRLKFRNGHA